MTSFWGMLSAAANASEAGVGEVVELILFSKEKIGVHVMSTRIERMITFSKLLRLQRSRIKLVVFKQARPLVCVFCLYLVKYDNTRL